METLLIGSLGIASAVDWKYRKIPNWLTFPLIMTGLIFHSYSYGLNGFSNSFGGLITGALLLYIPFTMGGVGGGDVKLMAALGAWLGPVAVAKVFLATALFGGVFSFVEMVRHKKGRETLKSLKERMLYFALTRKVAPESQISFTKNPVRIPYATMISCGYLWFYYFGGH